MSHQIYIAFGTNIGDRMDNLRRAHQALAGEVKILQYSPVYETPPWGILDQPAFFNQVASGETELSPSELIAFLKHLEKDLGRQPGIRYGPRLIDLDLLFYDDLVLESPNLTIPHPRMEGRGFVLLPLADLAPDLVHPVLKKAVRELLADCDLTGILPVQVDEPSTPSPKEKS